jgi:hypothetical protein
MRRDQILVIEKVLVHRFFHGREAREDGGLADQPAVFAGDRGPDSVQQPAQRDLPQVSQPGKGDPLPGQLQAQRRVDDRVILGRLQHRRLLRLGGHQPDRHQQQWAGVAGPVPVSPGQSAQRQVQDRHAPLQGLLV